MPPTRPIHPLSRRPARLVAGLQTIANLRAHCKPLRRISCRSRRILGLVQVSASLVRNSTRAEGLWRGPRGRVAAVAPTSADALLGLLHPAWQALIAGCLVLVTVLGLRRLLERGPARMTNALVVTGLLIVLVTAIGLLAVSCSGDGSSRSSTTTPTGDR